MKLHGDHPPSSPVAKTHQAAVKQSDAEHRVGLNIGLKLATIANSEEVAALLLRPYSGHSLPLLTLHF
jgi:hypothetical protein